MDERYAKAKEKFKALGRPHEKEPKEKLVSVLNSYTFSKFMQNPHAYLALHDYLGENALLPE